MAGVLEDGRLLERIEIVHAVNYHAYGYRGTWKALTREGVSVGRVKRARRAKAREQFPTEARSAARLAVRCGAKAPASTP